MAQSEFEIYALSVGAGQVALSPIPGRFSPYENDLSAILHWAPDMVLTMTGQSELDRVGATGFGHDLQSTGIIWHHLAIVDFGAPTAKVDAMWPQVSAQATDILARGGRILTHCFGGCGRSGMAALRLMIEAGEASDVALTRLRETRPCAVEEDSQFEWAASVA